LQDMNVKCERVGQSDLIKMSYKGHVEFLLDKELPYIPLGYKNIIRDYFFSKQLFLVKGIPVLPGDVFSKNELERALDYVQHTLGWPVVIKPTNKSCGAGVYCAIQTEGEFTTIWDNYILPDTNHHYLIETCWTFCPDYRFMVFKEGKSAVVKRTAPFVIGDGKHNINQLVNIINQQRKLDKQGGLSSIIISDQDGLRCLADQGLTPLSFPAKGAIINVRYMSNVKDGGISETIDNHLIHPTYWMLLDSIWAFFPELPYLSADLLIWDVTKPATMDNAVVKALHTTNSIATYLAPGKGEPMDVLTPLLNIIFSEIGQQ
jgi:cyanophycin synthetase